MNPLHPVYLSDLSRALDGVSGLDALRNASLLLTGATGMVGACIADMLGLANERLGLNLHIYALCRNENRAKERFSHLSCVEVIACDLTKPLSGLPKADYILHAASNAHPLAFSADPVGTMQSNILGAMNLLDHLVSTGGRRLLFVSTGEIYGENPDVKDGFSEDSFGKIDPMNPRSCYPESKRAAETICASYVRQFGADAVVARLCYIYGPTIAPDNSRADAQFLRKALAKENIVMKSEGTQMRSYCYVADAAAALLTILLRGEAGHAYNVAHRGGEHTIREYAQTLAGLAGVALEFDLPPEHERAGYSTVTRAVQNPAKLEALGWKATTVLNEGLGHTLEILTKEV